VEDIGQTPKYAGTYRWNHSSTATSFAGGERPKGDNESQRLFPPDVFQRYSQEPQLLFTKGDQWSDQELWQKLNNCLSRRATLRKASSSNSTKVFPSLSYFKPPWATFEHDILRPVSAFNLTTEASSYNQLSANVRDLLGPGVKDKSEATVPWAVPSYSTWGESEADF